MTLATIFWSQNYSRKNIWIVSPLQLYCQFIFGYAEFGYSSKNVILGSKWMYRSDALLSCIWDEFVHKELHFSAISGRHMEGCYLRAPLQIRLTLTLLVFIPWQSHSYADKSVFDTGMFNISAHAPWSLSGVLARIVILIPCIWYLCIRMYNDIGNA